MTPRLLEMIRCRARLTSLHLQLQCASVSTFGYGKEFYSAKVSSVLVYEAGTHINSSSKINLILSSVFVLLVGVGRTSHMWFVITLTIGKMPLLPTT